MGQRHLAAPGVSALLIVLGFIGVWIAAPAAATSPDLGTLVTPSSPNGRSSSVAKVINPAGQVTGVSDTASGQGHAFRWTRAGGMRDLGTLGGSYADSFAAAINPGGR